MKLSTALILSALLFPLSASAASEVIDGECVVTPRHDMSVMAATDPDEALSSMNAVRIRGRGEVDVIRKTAGPGIMSERRRVPTTESHRRFCREVAERLGVLADPNYIYRPMLTSGDVTSDLYAVNRIELPAAWDISQGSSSVKVGILDTGVDYTHPELSGNISVNTGEIPDNGVDDDGNGLEDDYYGFDFADYDSDPMDEHGHGTHVSGTIGAVNGNGGVVGMNWHVGLVPAKVLGSDGTGTLDAVVEGINYLASRGVDVINMSLGSYDYSSTEYAAIAHAGQLGVLVAAAAGNEGNDNDGPDKSYPASYDLSNIISVAATDSEDELAYFSNYGQNTVDIAAPGVDILSTAPGGGYDTMSGTSMATPHVAGVAALIKSVNLDFGPSDLRRLLLENTDSTESLDGWTVTGGRLNARRSMQAAVGLQPAPDTYKLSLKALKGSSAKKVRLSAKALLNGLPLSSAKVSFKCNNRPAGAKNTNSAGKAVREVKRRKMSCVASLDNGTTSKNVSVKKN